MQEVSAHFPVVNAPSVSFSECPPKAPHRAACLSYGLRHKYGAEYGGARPERASRAEPCDGLEGLIRHQREERHMEHASHAGVSLRRTQIPVGVTF